MTGQAEPAPRDRPAAAPEETGVRARSIPWPQDLSHEPIMRVSDVLGIVAPEFPALTASKLRFLDTQGLVEPRRSGGGYRTYSPADIERLRFVLRQQRDHFLPLDEIRTRLAALDSGAASERVSPRLATAPLPELLTAQELADAAGAGLDLVEEAAADGLIEPGATGRFPRGLVPVVAAVARYVAAGGDLRAARVVKNAAAREAALAASSSAPMRRAGEGSERSAEAAAEYGDAAAALFGAVVRQQLARD